RVPLLPSVSYAQSEDVLHIAGLTRGTLPLFPAANIKGTKNLLDAALGSAPSCPVVVVSSSAVYGYAGTTPIQESCPLQPVSDYGISKAGQEALCRQYMDAGKGRIAIPRPFNLVGPGQPDLFVCGKIIRQVVEIEQGKRDVLDLLETGSIRDFIDVRDVVQGYWSILSHPEFDRVCAGNTFNLGSGEPKSIADVIRILEEITGETYSIRLKEEPVPVPVPCQRSDNRRISAATGWKAAIPLSTSLRDMLDAARNQAGVS
ncbi:GDP-mannose 4,6-dehydratase, partial [Methanoregula sp.]|uniref:GDP-mannose 4,6-dehydratase n=1 Tax=Methanoregula sp. TaxID=2052170 RepID=UPI0025DF8D89